MSRAAESASGRSVQGESAARGSSYRSSSPRPRVVYGPNVTGRFEGSRSSDTSGQSERSRWAVPLLGRNRQLAELLRAVGQPPSVVRVEGEAGIGKTRLLAELMTRPESRAAVVLFGTCHRLREPFPFGPMIDALCSTRVPLWGHSTPGEKNPLLGALRPLLPEFGGQLPPEPPALGDARAERYRLFRAMRESLIRPGRVILVLDDLQWADEATLDFLRFLVDRMPTRLTVIAGYRNEPRRAAAVRAALTRPGSTGPLTVTTIALTPLTEADVSGFAKLVLGTEIASAELVAEVFGRTGGLPFAVEEVLRALRERIRFTGGHEQPGRLLTEIGVPGGVREAVLERLDALSDSARSVVEASAILGRASTERELAAIAELDEEVVVAGLTEALRMGMLRETEVGCYAPRHRLAQEAVHQTLAGPRRQRGHQRAATMLLAEDPVPHARIAYHCERSGDQSGWRRHSEFAADEAVRVGDMGEAVVLLRRLLDSVSEARGATDEAERVRLAVKLGWAAVNGLAVDGADRVLSALIDEPGIPRVVRAGLRCDLGMLRLQQVAEPIIGYRELEAAVPDLIEERPDAAAEAMSALAIPYTGHQHISEHLRWLDRLDRIMPRVTGTVATARIEVNRVSALLHSGQDVWDRARFLLGTPDDDRLANQYMRGCVNVADSAVLLGYYDRAEEYLGHATHLLRPSHSQYMARMLEVTTLFLDWARGRWTGLRERAESLREQNRELPRVDSEYDLIVGALALSEGDSRTARARLSRIDVASGPVSMRPSAITATALLVGLDVGRGAMVAAVRGIDQAVGLVRQTGMWVWAGELMPVAVRILAGCERMAEAVTLVDEFADGVSGVDSPMARATLDHCRGELAERRDDPGAAIVHYGAAADRFQTLPRPYGAARLRLARGRCRLSVGDTGGVEDVSLAAGIFEDLGAAVQMDQCRRLLREHAALPPRRRGRPGYGERLSPRELEVSRLAASGATNRDIAQALNLSPRTVEQHVSRVLRKLGVANRQDLRLVLPAQES